MPNNPDQSVELLPPQIGPHKLSRRKFLKLTKATAELATVAGLIDLFNRLGVRNFEGQNEDISNLNILVDIFTGKFSQENIGPITTPDQFIQKSSEFLSTELPQVKSARLLFSDLRTNTDRALVYKSGSDRFIAASIIKPVIVYDWISSAEQPLNQDQVKGLLRFSDNDLLIALANQVSPNLTAAKEICAALTRQGVAPISEQLPLEISLTSLFNWLKGHREFPSIMTDNMTLNNNLDLQNYGFSKIISDNQGINQDPVLFKLGIINTPEGNSIYNPYLFLVPNKIALVGYSTGSNKHTHYHMAHVAACLASYLRSTS